MTVIQYRCQDVFFSYKLDGSRVEALRGINLEIKRGDFICFKGPSGSGKSTLLNLLGLIENVQSGEVLFNGTKLSTASESEKNAIRKFNLGFVFQSFNLLEALTAEENVGFFLERQNLPKKEVKERIETYLSAVGLWEHRRKKPGQMSGGQKQRVSIARALAKQPEVIIADEPTASLDQVSGKDVMKILADLSQQQNVTVILSSHDPMAIEFAQTVKTVRDGMIQVP